MVGFALFPERPTSSDVCRFLGRAISRADAKPKYIIADKGKQFWCSRFKRWCRRRHIKPRFGAVGKHGSVAVIERFIRSLKDEGTRRVIIPLSRDAARAEITAYVTWYDQERPHQSLGGKTPWEVYRGIPPANQAHRFEPRRRWPTGSPCSAPATRIKGRRGVKLDLVLRFADGRKHLPTVELKRAA